MTALKRIVIFLMLTGFIYLLVLQVVAIWPFTIDDMYISLRYARNWAEGAGLLWNIKEAPVEGYSNFSFVAIATFAIKLGFDPVFTLKFIGAVGLFLTTIAVYCLSRLLCSTGLALIPCVWLLLYKAQIIWAVSGLETTLYQALISFALFFLLRATGYNIYPRLRGKFNNHYFALTGLLLGLASVTRPEGPFFLLLFLGIAWFDKPVKHTIEVSRGIFWGCLIFGLVYIPYFAWRWYYFGRLFPNPVYCKGFTDSFSLEMDKNYFALVWPFFLLVLPAIWKAQDKRHFYFWLPSIVYLLLLVGSLPIAAFDNRLFLPAFTLLLPLVLVGMMRLTSYFLKQQDEVFYGALVLEALLFAFFFIPVMSLTEYRYFTDNPKAGERLRQDVFQWLKTNVTLQNKVVLADSGMIPYLSPLDFVDSYCLNNKKMAEQPDRAMYTRFCSDVFQLKPAVIILTSLIEKGHITYTPADVCLHDKIQHSKLYKFRAIYSADDQQSTYRYEIYTVAN